MQCGYGVVLGGQFGFGQGCVDFQVANVVQPNGRAVLAAFQLGDQVMCALLGRWRDRAIAKGADRIGHFKNTRRSIPSKMKRIVGLAR